MPKINYQILRIDITGNIIYKEEPPQWKLRMFMRVETRVAKRGLLATSWYKSSGQVRHPPNDTQARRLLRSRSALARNDTQRRRSLHSPWTVRRPGQAEVRSFAMTRRGGDCFAREVRSFAMTRRGGDCFVRCVIRSMATSESGASRPPNPEHVVH
jgi:hypothetical protein